MWKKRIARLSQILSGAFSSQEDAPPSPSGATRFEQFLHFWVLVWKSFVRNRCPMRASALSYTTLLALIPTIAVAMSITSLFLKAEGEERIQTFIEEFVDRMLPQRVPVSKLSDAELQWMFEFGADVDSMTVAGSTNSIASGSETNSLSADDPQVTAAQRQAASKIHEFIQNTYSGTLGAAGMVFLLWVAINLLTRVEETLNDIWGVTHGRDWWSRVTNYFTVLVISPALLVSALGLASGPHFEKTQRILAHVPFLEPIVSQLLPIVVISFTFALLYKTLPNTKVNFSAAIVGGALAGTTWHIFNLLSVHAATRVVTASKIYGSLALVPLIMLGLYAVWTIILFGSQVAYAFQNREAYLQDRLAENVNQRGREFVALRLMTCICQRFHRGLPPATVSQISSELGIPSRLVQQVLQTLLAAHLVVEVSGREPAYAPARPLDTMNAHHVLMAMRATTGQELVTRDEPVRSEVLGEFARIEDAEKHAATGVNMLALVHRAEAKLELSPPQENGDRRRLVAALAASPSPAASAPAKASEQSASPEPGLSPSKAASSLAQEPAETSHQHQVTNQPPQHHPDAAPEKPESSNDDTDRFPL